MTYADERLELFPRLQQAAGGRPLAELFRLDGRSLRFHLGTSLADLRVPVAIDRGLAAAFQAAALDLFFLLCARHRAGLRESEYDQLLLLNGFDPQAVRPVSFSAPGTVAREGVRRAFLEAPELHPALDCGVVAGWIGQGRPGRTLIGAINTLLRRALDESAQSEHKEPTAYLALLSLRALCAGVLEPLRKNTVGPPMARPLHGAVAAGMLLALRLGAREAGLGLDALGGAQAAGALAPLAWLAEGRQLSGSFLTAYGVAFNEPPPRIDALAQKLAGGATLDAVARELHADISASKDVALKAERSAALAALRAELLLTVRLAEDGRAPPLSLAGLTLQQLYGLPGALEKIMATPDRRKELQAKARAAAKASTNEPARQRFEALAHAAKEWHEDRPSHGWMRPGEAHKLFLHASCALAVDHACERLLAAAERSLSHRSGAESEDGLEAEQERGRLYFMSFGPKPILAARAGPRQMGHLFCDVKDFTKRTAFLKEAVVADFLQREFYAPILTAAARHHHGASHLGDKGGLYLNNLLGDAVSFSGDIASCVQLTADIREALENYARRLDGEANREVVARTIADIEERCAGRKEVLGRQIAAAEAAREKGVLDPESGEEPGTRLRRLRGELGRLEDERESELSLITGEKLEAGIFISYGAAPEVSTFEDHVFGAIKVSIAEKINESARGTARNGGVRARVDSLLTQARTARKKPELSCPFSVFLSQPLSIPVPSELEAEVRSALELGDLDGAEEALRASVHAFVNRLANETTQPAGGDIYNGGAALTEEALTAYLEARGDDYQVVRRELPAQALHPELQGRFVFPQTQLQLVCLVGRSSMSLMELFVYAGRALFKGLEKRGGLGVYEIVPRSSDFFALVAQHHVGAWLAEADRDLPAPAESWSATPYLGVPKYTPS